MPKIINHDQKSLCRYLSTQINNLFPDADEENTYAKIDAHIAKALDRTQFCINQVQMWNVDEFDPMHSNQNTQFIYYLANTIWNETADKAFCTKLFYLNKSLNAFECFYDTVLPDIFFIGHSVGIVLARVTYSNYLILYQNCTVGRVDDAIPILDEKVALFANSAVVGRCHIREKSVISQGQSVINHDTPGNCLVFNSEHGNVVTRHPKHDIFKHYFRNLYSR